MEKLTFDRVSEVNLDRALVWHNSPNGIDDWSPAEWGNAMAGEAGELCNVLKKILRYDKNIAQANNLTRQVLIDKAKQEIGDTFLYLDLIARRLGVSMAECVVDTFNRVSEREGFTHRL